MNKSVIFSLFLMASLLMGTSLNMNMFSPAMGAMGQGMGQYNYNNNGHQSTYEKDAYANSYSNSHDYERQPSYHNDYDKSSYFMDSYGDRLMTTKIRLRNMSVEQVHLKASW